MRHAWVVGSLLAVGLLSAPRAEACGGFFCSQTPINQAGERIVFGVNGNQTEAHIQIQYQGAAEKFAWVVPVQARPTLSIGSARLFSFLDQVTQPRFQLQWENSCEPFWPRGDFFDSAPPSPSESPTAGGGVQVVSREDVGPYDAVILTAQDAKELRTWLTTNGYDIPVSTTQALEPYVGSTYYFVALKLQQNKGVGDLKPLVVKFEGTRPCVPIRLTAIAAQPDMPIIAYVLSNHRAVPMNYRHVLINPTRVNWLMGGINYPQVATAAVDEAGGQAFLTEFAGSAASLRQNFTSALGTNGNFDTSTLARISHPVDFAAELMRPPFLGDAAVQGLLRKYVPMPASLVAQRVPEAQFYNSLFAYRSAIDQDPGRAPFDAQGFAKELDEQVVKPLKSAMTLLGAHPYLTRLYTTMSAEEMSVDPDFDFNADAPAVTNVFTAKARYDTCESDVTQRKVRIELPDGRVFYTRMSEPFNQGPNSERVEQYSNIGSPALIQDNNALIQEAIRATSPCGCGATEPGSAVVLGGALGAWLLNRRRRSA